MKAYKKRSASSNCFKKLCLEYNEHTTLHGLRYTSEKGVHTAERIFWIVTILSSVGICLYQTHNVWHKWQTSPVIVSFSEKIESVDKVPFPSITICPQIKVRPAVYNYTEHYHKLLNDTAEPLTYDDEMKTFMDVSLVCPSLNSSYLPGYNVTDASAIDTLIDVAPDSDYLFMCFWLGNYTNCSNMFTRVLTQEGVCFNFNGLASDEIFSKNIQSDYKYSNAQRKSSGWSPVFGYDDSDIDGYVNHYPHRGQYFSHKSNLIVFLKNDEQDVDKKCQSMSTGYSVYIQEPSSHPQSSVYSYAILPGQTSAIALKVNMMNTSEKLQSYDSATRQCYYTSEKYLRYFKLYTASNCLLECMSNYTYKTCHCVPFHMPHSDGQSICTKTKEICVKESSEPIKQIKYIKECNCLPNCNSVTYEAEILKTELTLKNILKENFVDSFENTSVSMLKVYYRDGGFVTITRSELFGVTDFLAFIGGLLSLFLGFSFLSLVEIVYFFTIRLGYLACKDKIKNQENDIEDLRTNAVNGSEPTKTK